MVGEPGQEASIVRDVSLSVGAAETLCLVAAREMGCGETGSRRDAAAVPSAPCVRVGIPPRRARSRHLRKRRCARSAKRHDLPGPDERAQPRLDDRRSGGGGPASASQSLAQRCPEPRRRPAAAASVARTARPAISRSRAECGAGAMMTRWRLPASRRCSSRTSRIALDATIPAQILDLLRSSRALRHGACPSPRTFGIVRQMGAHVAVMYAGRIVESGRVRDVLRAPQHPFTRALMASIPRLGMPRGRRLDVIGGNVRIPWSPRPAAASGRAAQAFEACEEVPPLLAAGAQRTACWLLPRQPRRGAMTEVAPLLDVRALHVHFPSRAASFAGRWDGARRRRSRSRRAAQRDPRPGRQIGLRKVDPQPRHPAMLLEADLRRNSVRGPEPRRP